MCGSVVAVLVADGTAGGNRSGAPAWGGQRRHFMQNLAKRQGGRADQVESGRRSEYDYPGHRECGARPGDRV